MRLAGRSASVELWRWRYRCPETGRTCETLLPMSDDEAAHFTGSRAERIAGTRIVVESGSDGFEDTKPGSPRR